MDFEKTLNDATDSILLSPKLDLFESLASVINGRLTGPRDYFPYIKKRLLNKHPRTKLLTLEFIEYLTCVSTQPIHNALHERDFLQVINSTLQTAATDDIKLKCLHIVQFWATFFERDRDIFPNFEMMYVKAKNAGIQFNPSARSQYAHLPKMIQQQQPTHTPSYGLPQQSPDQRILKIKNDLDILRENIQKGHGFLDSGHNATEHFNNLKNMHPKMIDLIPKLRSTGNHQITAYAEQIDTELGVFIQRLSSQSQDHQAPKFNFNQSDNPFDDFNAGSQPIISAPQVQPNRMLQPQLYQQAVPQQGGASFWQNQGNAGGFGVQQKPSQPEEMDLLNLGLESKPTPQNQPPVQNAPLFNFQPAPQPVTNILDLTTPGPLMGQANFGNNQSAQQNFQQTFQSQGSLSRPISFNSGLASKPKQESLDPFDALGDLL